MANSHYSFVLLFLAFFFYSISLNCSASSSSATVASDQLRFWSENVLSKIPESILKKLSPLSRNDRDYYSNALAKNGEFSADANFCSLAKLACSSVLDNVKTVTQTYTTTKMSTKKTYGQSAANSEQATENEDPFSFFRMSNLKSGNLIHLPNLEESIPDRAFLPTQIASKITLSYDAITKTFPDSVAVAATKETIETTLSYCNDAAIQGEVKRCPKSLEEMVDFARFALGEDKKEKLMALTSKNTRGSDSEMMIGKLKEYGTGRIVACHEAFLPFAAYFCHSLTSTRLYAVELVDTKTRAPVNTMMAICHMDTSPWPASHVAFKILKFGPGEGEACHWFTQVDLAWIADVSV